VIPNWLVVPRTGALPAGAPVNAAQDYPELTQFVRPFMSYGKDECHVDRHLWKLPIALYDPANEVHRRLSELGKQQADDVAALELDEAGNFITLRQRVRDTLRALAESRLMRRDMTCRPA
jgi:hypothetical protein